MNSRYKVGDHVLVKKLSGIFDVHVYEVSKVSVKNSLYTYEVVHTKTFQSFKDISESRLKKYLEYPEEISRSDLLLDKYLDYMELYRIFGDRYYMEEAIRYKEEWILNIK